MIIRTYWIKTVDDNTLIGLYCHRHDTVRKSFHVYLYKIQTKLSIDNVRRTYNYIFSEYGNGNIMNNGDNSLKYDTPHMFYK